MGIGGIQGSKEGEKSLGAKAPWDQLSHIGLRLLLSRWLKNMTEYLKVSVNELIYLARGSI